MYDNVFVTAFYRDVLVNNSGKGLDYIIKYLEIQDNNASKSVGDMLRLTLEQNITNSVTRTFKLVKDFTLTKDTSSINVTTGKIDIISSKCCNKAIYRICEQ